MSVTVNGNEAFEDMTKLLQWEDYPSGPMEPRGPFQNCGQGRCNIEERAGTGVLLA